MDVVIVSALRTPMGCFLGALREQSAPALAARVVQGLLQETGVPPAEVDELYLGNVLGAGLGQAPARQAALLGGLDCAVPCTTVNKVCGSGMKSVMLAADQLRLGEGEVMIAGGMESMSRAPYLLQKARTGLPVGPQPLHDHLFLDGLQDPKEGRLMGHYAQQLADQMQISRAAMDEYALASLCRARSAIESGAFAAELLPVREAERVLLAVDELPGRAKADKITQLGPAFGGSGSITAANASAISDGAAALLLMSRAQARRRGLPVQAAIRGYVSYAARPAHFPTAPINAIQVLLRRLGWRVGEVDLFEINEAFALVALLAMEGVGISHDRLNVQGGACALGHPLGASGARILVTLIHALRQRGGRRGIASLCIGGGEAIALALEVDG